MALPPSTNPEIPDDELDDYLLVETTDKWDRDPLIQTKPTRIQREFFRWINDPRDIEVYWRSGNQGAKTKGGAIAAGVLARADPELSKKFGLPYIPPPNVGWVLTQSYKQQVDASQKALASVIGKWPHYISYVTGKGKGYWESVYIKTRLCRHKDGDHCEDCSKITFHCEESDSSIGGRIDWAWADEPPKEAIWREIRGRRTANRVFPKFITATPLEWERWFWLSEDFDDCLVFGTKSALDLDEDKYGAPKGRRAEIRSTIFDNEYLSKEHIEKQLEDWKGDQRIDARIRGDYVDIAGECPFDLPALDRMAAKCRPPIRIESIRVQSQIDSPKGRLIVPINVDVEFWYDPEPDEKYFIVCDLSSGTKAKGRDPSEMGIFSRRNPRLVARYGFIPGYKDEWQGYIKPYGLGSLAAIMARRYNNALVDPEMNGGWGDPFLTALNAAGYGNVSRDIDPARPGFLSAHLGFRSTVSNRGSYVGEVQAVIEQQSIEIPSAFYVHTFKNVVMVRKENSGLERGEAAKGKKDDAFIVASEAAKLLRSRPMKPVEKDPLGKKKRHRIPQAPALRW